MTSIRLSESFESILEGTSITPHSNSSNYESQSESTENSVKELASTITESNNKVACSSCREKKLKCDKILPTCTRCKSKNMDCVYIEHKKTGPKPSGKPRVRGKIIKKRQHEELTPESPLFPGFEADSVVPTYFERSSFLYDTSLVSECVSSKKLKKPFEPSSHSNQQQGNHKNEDTQSEIKRNRSPTYIKEREELLGLREVGLTLDDVDKIHNFWFQYSCKVFRYSKKRYLYYFEKEGATLLHFCYMLWAAACLSLPGYESKSTILYEKSLTLGERYWEGVKHLEEFSDFHSMYYLHGLAIRLDFEFMTGRELRSALTLSCAVRLSQMFGYDQLDIAKDKLLKPTVFLKKFDNVDSSIPKSASEILNSSNEVEDDNLDDNIPLIEEKRRIFWGIYAGDKWYSLVTGLPSSVTVDSHTVIFTKLPSPTTFLALNNSLEVNELNEQNTSYYLHEAMHKLDANQVLIDLNSSSSKILLLTISENIIKWCKIFLNMVEFESLNTKEGLITIKDKVEELIKNFENLQSNLLLFDMSSEPLLNIVVGNTTTVLYHTVLIKFSCLFQKKAAEDPTGSSITVDQKEFFVRILYEVSNLSLGVAERFLKKDNVSDLLSKASLYILLANSLKSLLQSSAFFKRFGKILNLDVEIENAIDVQIAKANKLLKKAYKQNQNAASKRMLKYLSSWIDRLNNQPEALSFFDAFA